MVSQYGFRGAICGMQKAVKGTKTLTSTRRKAEGSAHCAVGRMFEKVKADKIPWTRRGGTALPIISYA